MHPSVSVIIPTYNRANKVSSAIQSVFAQTVSDVEVIVVDDGSSDGTQHLLTESFGDRIRYYFQPNQGVSVARNKGIEEARGTWIAFLDSDDQWKNDKLEWQLKTLKQFGSHSSACYTDVQFTNHSETRTMFELAASNYRHKSEMGINCDALRLLVKPGGAGMVICLSSLLARANEVRRAGGFDARLLYTQDSEFMFRLAMRTDFCYVNRPLVLFDRSPAEDRHIGVSSAWNRLDFFLLDSQLRLEGLLQLTNDQAPAIRNVVRQQLASIHSGWVNYYLEAGQNAKARAAAVRAVRLGLNINSAVKWLLTCISPQVALRIVRQREKKRSLGFSV